MTYFSCENIIKSELWNKYFNGLLISMTEASHVTADFSLILQLVIFILLLYGYRLFRNKQLKSHGIITSFATILHTVLIFLVMVPTFIGEKEHFITEFFEPVSL